MLTLRKQIMVLINGNYSILSLVIFYVLEKIN